MSANIVRKSDDPALFWSHWERFAEEHLVSPRHTRGFVEYMLEISHARGYLVQDLSFVYVEKDMPLACVFLPLEKHGDAHLFSFDGSYIIAPLFTQEKAAEKIFREVDTLARRHNVQKILFQIEPLESDRYPYNFLQQYDYLDASILSYVVDLTSPGELLEECRKNHRQRIRKTLAREETELFVMDASNADYRIHEEYRHLHFKAAGRATRTKESFDSQFERLKRGNAILVGLRRGGKAVSYANFELSGGKALYASAADDPDDAEGVALGTYHATNFFALQYLKEHGIEVVDLTQPSTPSPQFDCYPDKKQSAIAAFKWGFPGRFVPSYRGIRYFSDAALRSDVERFLREYPKAAKEWNARAAQ